MIESFGPFLGCLNPVTGLQKALVMALLVSVFFLVRIFHVYPLLLDFCTLSLWTNMDTEHNKEKFEVCENTRLVKIIYQNIPSPRWNEKRCKILEFFLETQMLTLFLFLFPLSFFIDLLDNFIVRKLYQSLDDTNVVFAALKLFGMNESLIQWRFNSIKSKKGFIHREKKKMYSVHERKWKLQVDETNFDSVF